MPVLRPKLPESSALVYDVLLQYIDGDKPGAGELDVVNINMGVDCAVVVCLDSHK